MLVYNTNKMTNIKPQKTPNNYCCITCDFYTSNKKDYSRHLSTHKHKILTNTNEKNPKKPQNFKY